MSKEWFAGRFGLLLIVALIFSLLSPVYVKPVSADPGKQTWSVIDTPGSDNNTISSPSEINVIVIGSDDRTVYAVDIPNAKIYKSINNGVRWPNELSGYLPASALPVWNLAVAPDDVNFLVAVADGDGTPSGPLRIFISKDGGANWEMAITGLSLAANEYISCVDISVNYGNNNRDIAIGTRVGAGTGTVWIMKVGVGTSIWVDQSGGSSIGWIPGDVVALKFSPSYITDNTLVVVYSTVAGGTFLNAGRHDLNNNFTDWTAIYVVPILLIAGFGTSPNSGQIITADLELPSDFSGADSGYRRFYVSTDIDTTLVGVESGVYRVDDAIPYYINPPSSGRISSIAYRGTCSEGELLAGEVGAAPAAGIVYVRRTSNPHVSVGVPTWSNSDTHKSPTGGFGSGFANAQVAWSPDGATAYCGTSSANPTLGGTAWPGPNRWPQAWLNNVPLDESALSVSPYSPDYARLLVEYDKDTDTDVGNIWNQISLIDTQITWLADVASIEMPESTEAPVDYNILYLASVSVSATDNSTHIWRSTSDTPGSTWERILRATVANDVILRIKQMSYEDPERSQAIVYADLNTQTIGYSEDEGQFWEIGFPFPSVTDLAMSSDDVMFILDNSTVYRYEREGTVWQRTDEARSELDAGHTIAVPLKNPAGDVEGETEDWVIVGEAGPPNGFSRVAWADFSQGVVKFEPPLDERDELPVPGNVHVITDDRFESNKTIYAASHDAADTDGRIYRWKIGSSTAWEELEPPNRAFYGLGMRHDVLYGVWRWPLVPGITSNTGADRTLFPRANVPPPPEWDYLVNGLPAGVFFTREPSAVKVSSNEYNNLWAIDDRPYDWANQVGCLWGYTDMVAKVGPWTNSPASGDSIPVDPVSGRAEEVNFKWRQLSYASVYELQVAKDSDFSIVLLLNQNITPVNPLSPECYFPAGGLLPTQASSIAGWGNLESGHTYYWRVRSRTSVTGEIVRSPWSATMYFTVEAGLPVVAPYPTLTLFSPAYGARGVSRTPSFSWSPMPKTTKYEFVLARDAALQDVVVKTTVPLTSYLYDGELDFNASYFWQVRVVEPIVSDPSAIGIFTVVAEEKPAGPVTEEPSPIPSWTWWVIAVCFAMVIAMIAFAMVQPRYSRPKAAPAAKSATKLELDTEKPHVSPKASSITELELDIDKPPSLFARIWGSIKTGIGRLRYLGKRGGGNSGENIE